MEEASAVRETGGNPEDVRAGVIFTEAGAVVEPLLVAELWSPEAEQRTESEGAPNASGLKTADAMAATDEGSPPCSLQRQQQQRI